MELEFPPAYMDVFRGNLKKLSKLLDEEFDTLVLFNTSNITYITGLQAPSGAAILSRECPPALAVPLLDYQRVSDHALREFEVYIAFRGGEESIEAEVPKSRVIKGGVVDAVKEILRKCGAKRVGADLSAAPHSIAKQAIEKAGAEDVTQRLYKIRAIKDPREVELIEEAAKIAEAAFSAALSKLLEGVSELELAGLIHYEMRKRGAWYEAFPTIVAFYSNTAYPHHTPGSVRLGKEGPVLIDWGAVTRGYRSDMTRTLWHGTPAGLFKKHLEAVARAQAEAIDTIHAGVEAWEVDRAARRVLEKEGLARYFIHGLGHGVGIDVHEEPYLRPGSKTVLEKGMVVTVEPGIYLPGMHGIRIEDLALVTPSGARLLTRLPRIL
ncbi:MAG: Xaa-Pro peptidase family protein [Desulfurococcales archaeon]|nr:Xaa-Pro peptidase family protein [Desulfurococcales archaeon]